MTDIVEGYSGCIVCPKFDGNGIDNELKLPGLRNVVQANFGNIMQQTGTMYTYARTYDDQGNFTGFTETPLDVYILTAHTFNVFLMQNLAEYADLFSNGLGVDCTVIAAPAKFAEHKPAGG